MGEIENGYKLAARIVALGFEENGMHPDTGDNYTESIAKLRAKYAAKGGG